MKTTNVDLAAYLCACGVEPFDVTKTPYHGNARRFTNEYHFADDEMTETVKTSFYHNAHVPITTFLECRARMKSYNGATRNAVKDFRLRMEQEK